MTENENRYPELANVKLDEIGVWSEIKIVMAVLRIVQPNAEQQKRH
jgi:hypothetical protein